MSFSMNFNYDPATIKKLEEEKLAQQEEKEQEYENQIVQDMVNSFYYFSFPSLDEFLSGKDVNEINIKAITGLPYTRMIAENSRRGKYEFLGAIWNYYDGYKNLNEFELKKLHQDLLAERQIIRDDTQKYNQIQSELLKLAETYPKYTILQNGVKVTKTYPNMARYFLERVKGAAKRQYELNKKLYAKYTNLENIRKKEELLENQQIEQEKQIEQEEPLENQQIKQDENILKNEIIPVEFIQNTIKEVDYIELDKENDSKSKVVISEEENKEEYKNQIVQDMVNSFDYFSFPSLDEFLSGKDVNEINIKAITGLPYTRMIAENSRRGKYEFLGAIWNYYDGYKNLNEFELKKLHQDLLAERQIIRDDTQKYNQIQSELLKLAETYPKYTILQNGVKVTKTYPNMARYFLERVKGAAKRQYELNKRLRVKYLNLELIREKEEEKQAELELEKEKELLKKEDLASQEAWIEKTKKTLSDIRDTYTITEDKMENIFNEQLDVIDKKYDDIIEYKNSKIEQKYLEAIDKLESEYFNKRKQISENSKNIFQKLVQIRDYSDYLSDEINKISDFLQYNYNLFSSNKIDINLLRHALNTAEKEMNLLYESNKMTSQQYQDYTKPEDINYDV